jgi:hypothetical protein
MKWIRRVHAWLGVLFAPAIVMFALSGIFQMFGWHEGSGTDAPPGWIARLAQLHMKQTFSLPRPKGPKPAAEVGAAAAAAAPAAEPPRAGPPRGERPSTMPMKIFLTLAALGLIASTLLGLYMAFTPKRDRRLLAIFLAAGLVVPVVMIAL